MPQIVSCSRRTDIPAFYTPWLLNRLEAGFCHVRNPYGPQIRRVSLRPEDVAGLIFWTRDPRPLLPHLAGLKTADFDFYFLMTITGYPEAMEPHCPETDRQVEAFVECAERHPGRVFWRYDPIVLSRATPPEYHLRRFDEISGRLEGHTARCYFSFAVWFRKTRANLLAIDTGGFGFVDPETETRRALVGRLRERAGERGMRLYSCCEDALVEPGIEKAHCADASLFKRAVAARPAPTRQDCGCWTSVDIGAYDTCLHGCRYCYATRRHEAAAAAHAAHDPLDSMLCRPPHLRGRDLDAPGAPAPFGRGSV